MAFEDFLDKVSELTQTGIAKGKELTDAGVAKAKVLKEVGKLRMQNATEQENMKKAYLELGRLYYAEHCEAPDEAYAGLCAQITAAKCEIAYNLDRIADIKAAGGLSDHEVEDIDSEDLDCDCDVSCEEQEDDLS